ncbi:RagB/SusD family nutrient uptake outer membrane protein [Flavobacterium cheongpyeongense]|uniref:RagB/SusD family nutrient uptake outer membrane protein n=1 Tax=Flavobacterium cheongpyeongense TaxID=2212651 RepID=A0A2V4BSS4_9FLAO|nr:RagB/SusD family nutrient uptake outer membrane protein [Flavobacterium cheongpyeongense]PXY42108.1 RagB/SusD family nutrient uptake outer membrane protein [Flavobacterium cheongpyeongense]
MKKYLKYITIAAVGAIVLSCDNYVDIKTEGKLIPEETQNYRYLLNNTSTLDKAYGNIDVASDDISFQNESQTSALTSTDYYRPFVNLYKWADKIYFEGERDYDMENLYNALYNINIVINEVMKSTNGTEAEKAALKGEAEVHRAFIFLTLVNTFGKAYDASTSATDPGIVLFTTPTVSDNIKRTSVQEAYNVIISDLNDAVNSGLKPINSGNNVAFPSRAAAYALLSRTYLYMRNYPLALENAEKALALQNTLNNLEDYEFEAYPSRKLDKELILSKWNGYGTYTYAPQLLSLSNELINLFDTNDLRYVLFTQPSSNFNFDYTIGRSYSKEGLTGESRNAGPTVPEMMLIKAECLARAGAGDQAIAEINKLRQKRFRTGEYVALTATDSKDALIKVLAERRRELMGTGGFRWFDLKRLNKEPEFAKTITHTFGSQTFTLAPNSDRYQLPFASIYFEYAPDLQQNP